MGKYLITGRQGSGKTSVIRELQTRGYTAYNTDEMPEVTRLEDRKTGQPVTWPDGLVNWGLYSWNWQPVALQKLLDSDSTVFIGAVTGNQADFYNLFDATFGLIINEATLKTHLAQHEHEYTSEDINRIVARHTLRQPRFVQEGAIPIDNNGLLFDTVDAILAQIEVL